MTPDELEKEAERLSEMFYESVSDIAISAEFLRALRAVHDAALEKAARLVDRGDGLAPEIRALKIGDGE